MCGRVARKYRRSCHHRANREEPDPAVNAIDGSTSRRYGPSRSNRYIARCQRVASSAFSTWTAARSAPPPFNDGRTKQMRGRTS